MDLGSTLPQIGAMVRLVVMAVVALLALVCLVDWLARTRRLNPFNPAARFLRHSFDPLIKPMEHRVIRAGGLPSAAPLWTLAVAVVLGLVLVTLVDFVLGQVAGAWLALHGGPREIFVLLVEWTFLILKTALLVRVIVSWLPVSPYSPWVRWSFVVSEPLLQPLRAVIPTLGMFDITPIVAYFILGLLEGMLLHVLIA